MKPAIIFFILWITLMVLWGESKDITPDLRNFEEPQSSKTFGHPIWNE